jgi:hypothetical protein
MQVVRLPVRAIGAPGRPPSGGGLGIPAAATETSELVKGSISDSGFRIPDGFKAFAIGVVGIRNPEFGILDPISSRALSSGFALLRGGL